MTPAVVDFETHRIQPKPFYPPIPVSVSIKLPGEETKFYAWGHRTGNNSSWGEAHAVLKKAWACKDGVVFHNAKFDVDVAVAHMDMPMLPWQKIHDTLLLLFLDNPHRDSLGLKPNAAKHGLAPIERDAVSDWLLRHQPVSGVKISTSEKGKNPPGAFIAYAPPEVVGPYANGDVDRTLMLFELYHKSIVDRGMGPAYDLEREVLVCLLDMEREGVKVDLTRLRRDVQAYNELIDKLNGWVRKRLKAPTLNLDSGPELVEALIQAKLVDISKMGTTPKEGRVKTSYAAIEAGCTDSQLAAVLKYRGQLTTCVGTFMEPWLRTAERNDGKIFTTWNQTKRERGGGTITGRLSSTPNCLTPDTEVLTKSGWIQISKLPTDIKVAQWSKTGEIEFVTPTIISRPYNGPMVKFASTHHRLQYTPDHRIPGIRPGHSGWRDYLASELVKGNVGFQIPVSGRWDGPGVFDSVDEAKFFVALRADGSYMMHNEHASFSFHLKKMRKRKRLENLLNLLGLSFKIVDSTAGRIRYNISGLKKLPKTFRLLKKYQTKKYRDWVLDLSLTERQVMVEEERYWDGCESKRSYKWSSADQVETEWFQTLVHLTGGFSLNYEEISNAKGYNAHNLDATLCAATCKPRGYITYDNTRPPKYVQYDGTVWCLRVPSSYFMVRRNGRILVTGNCQNIPKEFVDLFGNGKKLPKPPFPLLPLPLVRSYVTPFTSDEVLIGRDFHSQELRVLAHFIEGPLLEAYLKDNWLDVHEWARQMVNQMMGTNYTRKPIKNLGFSVLYGAGLGKIAMQLNSTVDQAKALLNAYLKVFPGLKDMYDDMRRRARLKQPFRTWYQREVFCEPPKIVNQKVMNYDYKMVNYAIQSSSAEITKYALTRFYRTKKPHWKLILQVHDELVVSCPRKEYKEAMDCLRLAMETPQLDLPMLSEGSWSEANWGSMINYDKAGNLVGA
ncbi:MAG: DNA polymerase [Gallionella sp.]|nr:DNA polymerase [Gallionella sp.]